MKRIAAMLTLAFVLAPAGAMVRGTTDTGRAFVSGGVDVTEQKALTGESGKYSLSILTAATGTGAYLADIHIQITDDKSHGVLDTVMDGPWLLVDLAAGQYTIAATLDGRVKTAHVSVAGNAHHEAIFYFNTHDQVEKPEPEPVVRGGN